MEFIKYPKIYNYPHKENEDIFKNPEDMIIIEEKVDGGNGQIRLVTETSDNEVFINGIPVRLGSRTRFLMGGLEYGQFRDCIEWMKNNINVNELDVDFIYFYEYMTQHTLRYGAVPPILGFDIMHIKTKKFLSQNRKRKIFSNIGIPIVQTLFEGKVKELSLNKLKDFIKKSNYGSIMMEGIVIKNYYKLNDYDRQTFAKLVTEDFKEMNRLTFNSFKKNDDSEKIVALFLTRNRIDKIIKKLINNGNKLERSLMKFLVNEVIEDILQENILQISKECKYMDFKMLRKTCAKKCLFYLDEYILLEHNKFKGK